MRLVIVEDNLDLLEKIGLIIDGEEDCDVVGSFASAEEVLPKLKELSPDAMLIDLGLPGMQGIDLIAVVKNEIPSVEIVAFSGTEDRETVLSVIRAGATGYLIKGMPPRELVERIQELCHGGAPMSPRISRMVINEVQGGSMNNHFLLSKREKEIIKRISDGLSYKEISETCNISPHTVHSHIKNIYEKLQANGRKEAIQTARRKGLL